MDVDELDDDDVYAKQLKQVFDSCDLQNKGYLNRNELIDLAQKLQLGDQVSTLLKELLGDDFVDGEVSFDEFRNGFVNVLANAIDCLSEITEDDQSEWSELAELGDNTRDTPTPTNPLDFDQKQNAEDTTTIHPEELKPTQKATLGASGGRQSKDLLRARSLPSTDSGNVDGDTSESAQLRQIWDDLGVGESGYINMIQLSEVCDHLGMEGMNDDRIELLFSELDKDQDGLISFDEFIEGLFLTSKRPNSDEQSNVSCIPPTNVVSDEKSPREKSIQKQSGEDAEKKKNHRKSTHTNSQKKRKDRKNFTSLECDIFASLDPNNTGKVQLLDLQTYLNHKNMTEFNDVVKDLKGDSSGHVQRVNFVALLERTVLESENSIAISVLASYKRDMEELREELENSTTKLNALKVNADSAHRHNKALVGESEEQLRVSNEQNQRNLRKQAKELAEQFSEKERELIEQRDAALEAHRNENELMEERLHEIKAEDNKTKEKLKEAAMEIERLEKNLTETVTELSTEKNKYSKLQREAVEAEKLTKKIDDLEGRITFFSDLRTKQKNKIKQLEDSNKALRTQNDDYESKLKRLKENRDDRVQRNGSCLSDYMKPQLVKRNQRGESMDELPSNNQEIDELRNKIFEQENIISSLRRDLETVNRMLDEKTSSINERHGRELSRLTDKYASEIADLQLMMSVERNELLQHHSKEKSDLIENFESKMEELKKNFVNAQETIINEHKHEKKRLEEQLTNVIDTQNGNSLKRDRRKMEKLFKEEKEEIQEKHRSETTKLRERIVCLETEKAEAELQFLNQKAELEQQYRIERAELMQNASNSNRECDRSQKYVDFLEEDLMKQHKSAIEDLYEEHQRDKLLAIGQKDNEFKELNVKHQKHINELTSDFENQVSEIQKSFAIEYAGLEEAFSREKTEMEQKFTRERKETKDLLQQDYEHKLAHQLAEMRKLSVEERTQVEEKLRDEKYGLCKNWQNDKSMYERKLKQVQTELELSFADERERMRDDFDLEKSIIEKKYMREISELQQAFSSGEAGLKGKIREDFHNTLQEQRQELEQSYQIEKEHLLFSFNREKTTLQSNWQLEKLSLKENFQKEKDELEAIFGNEKRELTDKFRQQKENLEEMYRKEKNKNSERNIKQIEEKLARETESLRTSLQHLGDENELLKQQKKELETKNQVLELKGLSLKQNEVEISEFLKEKCEVNERISVLVDEVEHYRSEYEQLKNEMNDTAREKDTILENSVQEITEQQASLSLLEAEKDALELKVNDLLHIADEYDHVKEDNMNLLKEIGVLQRALDSFTEVQQENEHLHDSLNSSKYTSRELEMLLQEKNQELTRLNDDVVNLQNNMQHLEEMYRKEIDNQQERLNMQLTTAATEKSRHLRELQDLKDDLFRANASSSRDNALKDKVFNDAKAEVMNLNRKLEEKSKKIRSLEEYLQEVETKMMDLENDRKHLDDEVQHWKSVINENKDKARNEKKNLTTKSIRSDTLVTELYIENAELMKQVANAESHQMKAEKQIRQLADQKRALQRVISKLCNAYGITNL